MRTYVFCFALFGLFAAAAGAQSRVTVGSRSATVQDSVVRLSNAAGRPVIEAFLFGRVLDGQAKAKLAAKRSPSTADFEELAGQVPLMELALFFANGSSTCNDRSLTGYTASFRKGLGSPFNIPGDKPVSFSFSKTAADPGVKIGILGLFCALSTHSPLTIESAGKRTTNSSFFRGALPPDVPPPIFTWRINLKGVLR